MEWLQTLANPHVAPVADDVSACAAYLLSCKENVTTIPAAAPRISGIYGLIHRGRIKYIGKSVNAYSRIREQRIYKDFKYAGIVPVEENRLSLVEHRMIRGLRPQWNHIQVVPRQSWGMVPMDDLAEVLNVAPGVIVRICEQHGLGVRDLNVDVRQVLWYLSRQ